jgi:hypothetical protein
MEIERYTLATGETALTGFNRYWRHWGLAFTIMVFLANLWPGWATSSATMFTYLFGGNSTVVAIIMLLAIGAILTLAPVVYVALEGFVVLKMIAIGSLFVVAVIFAIKAETWRALPDAVTHFGEVPTQLGFALVMGAVAYAGGGGGQNLVQSNWIRDKGFGMGKYQPRLVSPITGSMVASGSSAFIFEPTRQNMARWRRWWRFANLEQAFAFGVVTVLVIVFTAMLAHSTIFGAPGLSNSIGFLKIEGDQLGQTVGGWFAVLFWAVGAISLFATAVGLVDYTCRLAADVLKTTYLQASPVQESKVYFGLVWGFVGIGILVLLLGLNQPLILLMISACVAGFTMFIYSILLLVMNRRALPTQIRIGGVRVGALVVCIVFFGVLSALTIWEQVSKLFA